MATRKPRITFTQALFDEICQKIADGQSVRQACSAKHLPDRTSFNEWRKSTPELQAQYDRACLDNEDATCDDIQHIADTERDPAKARNMIDARKWKLKIRNRKVYGDHIKAEHSGPDGGPIQVERVRLNMKPVEELPE
jgi:hypothetical protein